MESVGSSQGEIWRKTVLADIHNKPTPRLSFDSLGDGSLNYSLESLSNSSSLGECCRRSNNFSLMFMIRRFLIDLSW